MKRKKRKKTLHDDTIAQLVRRLEGRYDFITTKLEYNCRGYDGEVDVLAYDLRHKTYHFYEIKSSYSSKSYHKALEQYHRYCSAHPKEKVKGVFVSPKKVRRLR